MNHSPQEIEKAFSALPDDLYDAMYQVDVNNTIFAVGKKYGVHIDKQELLKGNVLFVLLGLEKASDFSYNVKNKLGLSADDEAKLVNEINESVFKAVRDRFKEIRSGKGDENQEALHPEDMLHHAEHEVLKSSKIEIGDHRKTLTPKLPHSGSQAAPTPATSVPEPSSADPYQEPIE
jgi:hypothetical protein